MDTQHLDQIKGRCRIDDFTGCWVWAGATSPSNGGLTNQPRVWTPDYSKDPSGKTKTVQTGNRAAWHAYTGKPIPTGHRVFKSSICFNGLCVNPAHLQCGTTGEWGKLVTQKAIWKGQKTRIQANRAIGRTRSTVTPSLAREIQASNETGVQIATRTGLSYSIVSKVRKGQLVSVQALNNPFAGLMA